MFCLGGVRRPNRTSHLHNSNAIADGGDCLVILFRQYIEKESCLKDEGSLV